MTAAPERQPAPDEFAAYGLGWRAILCDRTVRITVRRLRHDHGTLRGYIDVEYKAPGTPRLGLPARLAGEVVNLSSGNERAKFANRLAERQPGLEWRNLVDAFCVEVERRDDDQEPAVMIGNLPAPINSGWLLEGLLERNQTNSVHGDGAVGKSWLALACAVSVVTGLEVLPGYKPAGRGGVLYCDYETDRDTMNARVQQIARGLGIAAPGIWYQRMDGPFSDWVERLMMLCQREGIVLVVIDSIEAAMAGSTGAGASPNEGPSKISRALRQLSTTALLIDHINAEQAAGGGVVARPYGNIFKRNWVRLAYHLKQAKEASPDGYRHLGLFNVKRNNGAEYDPVGLKWEVNQEVCRWEREEIDLTDLEDALPPLTRITGYLQREGPAMPAAIASGTGLKGGTVRPLLTRRRDLFVRLVGGRYGLVAEPVDGAGDGDETDEELP